MPTNIVPSVYLFDCRLVDLCLGAGYVVVLRPW